MRKDLTFAMSGDWLTLATLVAQRLLNDFNLENAPDEPMLEMDGKFGEKTDGAVRRFQRRTQSMQAPPGGEALVADGVVGPKTFNALGLREVVDHGIHLKTQPRGGRCWAAAAAMLDPLGREPDDSNLPLTPRGALEANNAAVRRLADQQNWEFRRGGSDPEATTLRLLSAPLWIGGSSVNARGTQDSIHAIVVGGVYEYDWSGRQVLLKIFDPWPPGHGRIYFMQPSELRLPGGNVFQPHWFLSPLLWTAGPRL